MSLTGITLIKNGTTLQYPYRECIKSLATYCDKAIVNVGISTDDTKEEVAKLEKELPNLKSYSFEWSEENTGDGRELAIQANNLLKYIDTEWVLYLQADEFLLESDGFKIKEMLKTVPREVSQIELFRTYFYGDIHHRLPRDELFLGRIFRKNTHTIGGDGMYLIRKSGEVMRTNCLIYHYSRIGTPEEITKRVRTLDRLFHPEEIVVNFDDFYYNETSLITYIGPHPKEYLKGHKGVI
jgi:glycosyltransferase involved in cell wall biosynthesis